MTRAEKFKEVFGLKIDVENADCGFFDCSDRESCVLCPVKYTQSWWNGEYEAPSQPQDDDLINRASAITEIMMSKKLCKNVYGDIYIKVTDATEILLLMPSVLQDREDGE